MNRGVSGFMKGIGMGIAVGCVAGAMGNSYMKSNKKGLKKNVGRALRNVGDLVDNVTGCSKRQFAGGGRGDPPASFVECPAHGIVNFR